MIIIRDKNTVNRIKIQRNYYLLFNDWINSYKLVLKNRGTNKEYEFYPLDDLFDYTWGYFTFEIDFSELPDDEYEYKLYTYENSEPIIINYDVWPISEIKECKINGDGEIIYSPKERILVFDLPTDYPYTYKAYGQYKYLEDIIDPSYFVNWMSEDGWQGGEYLQLEQYFDGVEIHPIGNAQNLVYINGDYNNKYYINVSYYENNPIQGNLCASGIIRINDLNDSNVTYNDNRTYIAYDRQ